MAICLSGWSKVWSSSKDSSSSKILAQDEDTEFLLALLSSQKPPSPVAPTPKSTKSSTSPGSGTVVPTKQPQKGEGGELKTGDERGTTKSASAEPQQGQGGGKKKQWEDWRGTRWSLAIPDTNKDPRFQSALSVRVGGGGQEEEEGKTVRWNGLLFGLPARSLYAQGLVNEKDELLGAFVTFSTFPSDRPDEPSEQMWEKERLLHAMIARCTVIKWMMEKDSLEYKVCTKKVKK